MSWLEVARLFCQWLAVTWSQVRVSKLCQGRRGFWLQAVGREVEARSPNFSLSDLVLCFAAAPLQSGFVVLVLAPLLGSFCPCSLQKLFPVALLEASCARKENSFPFASFLLLWAKQEPARQREEFPGGLAVALATP